MPLSGLTVFLTRGLGDNDELARQVTNDGGNVIVNPLIDVQYLPVDVEGMADARGSHAIMVTSANALYAVEPQLEQIVDVAGTSICYVVGERTARAAEELGLSPVHPHTVRTAHDLADYLSGQTLRTEQKRLLWLRGKLASVDVKEVLHRSGWRVFDYVSYETVLLPVSERNWEKAVTAEMTVAVFYSPSAVQAFAHSRVVTIQRPNHFSTVAIGHRTEQELLKFNLPVGAVAQTSNLDGVQKALKDIYERGF